jgi:ubiquinone/menaquinone biosynthesis C-methylase UbiE
MNVEQAVTERYSKAAGSREPALCCPVDYDTRLLRVIPSEILDRDYGCGDPTRYLETGEVVLDLGSGGGKGCYIAAQVVGAAGAVIGVDMNDEMLALAESYRETIGNRLGYQNVTFRKGKIQDLALDLRTLERYLSSHPVRTLAELDRLEHWKERQRRDRPLIPAASVDAVVSNCVINLVRPEHRLQLFTEMHRVLRDEGRTVISDIVCDRHVPDHLQGDPELWSGCLSGAYREDLLLSALEDAGFHGTRILRRNTRPWRIIEGIEFRSVTVAAFKGKPPEPAPTCC